MQTAGRGVGLFGKLTSAGIHQSARRCSAVPLLVALSFFLTLVQSTLADNHKLTHREEPTEIVNLQTVRLPIVDAVDNRFIRLSTAQGASQIKVDHMVQDDDGFMWFGTRYGLYRYDGYSFRVFAHDPANPNSLDGVDVSALFKDRDGALWVGCAKSLNKFDRTTERFERYPVPSAQHIIQDTTGKLWVASSSGLYSLDSSSRRVLHYSHDPNDPSSLSNSGITDCGEDGRGAFWVASDGHLDEFDRRAGKVTRRILLPEAMHGFRFYADHFGSFWIFHGSPNPLAVLDTEANALTHYAFPESGRTVTGVSAMLEDGNGELWIATHGLGLLKFDREHGRFIHYSNLPADPQSLPQDKLDALFADRVGNIWVAPGRMAPAFLPTKPPPFKRIAKVPGSALEPFVGALYEDLHGILWIGTPEALIRLDRKTGRITAYKTGGPEVGTDVVSICEDRSGGLWVGTYSHGLHRFDRKTGKFKTYRHNPADPYSLSNDIVMHVLVDRSGTLWTATADGLNRFDSRTQRFTGFKIDLPRTAFCLTLVEDQEGKMWIGTESSGLVHFDPATGQFVTYEHNRNLPGTLSDNRVNSVHFDHFGTMWVGTQNGLNKFDPRTGRFAAFTQKDGLPGNAVGCILEDGGGDLWMSTNNGVARFNSEKKAFSSFSTADGLPGPNLTGWGACFQSPSGEMFFGGFNGGASFFPDTVVDSSSAPPIVLTDFRLSGNPVEIGGHSPLRRSISYTTDLILSHQQNVFTITFTALSYASPATNRYRYRLEGLERDWNEVGSDRRQATYTTLPAATYTFRAQGATTSGPWSEPGVALRIEILPPWWATWWCWATSAALILTLLWALYRYRLHQIAQRFNTRMEARVDERTRIARELHDTLLQSFQALMIHFQAVDNLLPPGKGKDALEKVLDRADRALVEGRNAIQNIRSSTTVTSELSHAVTALGEELAGSHDGETGPATFRVSVEGTPRDLRPILRDDIYRIAREALQNAFRHAQASQIEADITYGDSLLRLRVRDDGKGIDPKHLQAGRDGHWGLPGMRERAQQIGAEFEMWSEVGAGTEVELRIPGSIVYEKAGGRGGLRLFRKKKEGSDER